MQDKYKMMTNNITKDCAAEMIKLLADSRGSEEFL
jgi:hypothetical protein